MIMWMRMNKFKHLFFQVTTRHNRSNFWYSNISQDKNFKISPKYDFYGEVHLASTNPNLEFSGVTKINHSCKNIPQEWVEFAANIDPNNILIPIIKDSVSKDDDLDRIYSGMVFNTTDSISLYGSFLGKNQIPVIYQC